MKKTIKIALGTIVILISLPSYRYTLAGFVLTIGGMGGDILFSGMFLLLNLLLTYSGIQICRNKLTIVTYASLILGLIPAVYCGIFSYNLYQRSDSKIERGDYQGTIKNYTRAIKKGNKNAYKKRGEIYYFLGEYKKAAEDFEREDEKGKVPYQELTAALIKLNDFDKAFEVFERYVAKEESEESRNFFEGGMLFWKGDYGKSLEEYMKLDEMYGESSKYKNFVRMANCYAKLGDNVKALEYYNTALENARALPKYSYHPSCVAHVLVSRGDFYFYTKNFDAALADYNEAVKYDASNDSSTVLKKAYLFVSLGDYSKALEELAGIPEANAKWIFEELCVLKSYIYGKLGAIDKQKEEQEICETLKSKSNSMVTFTASRDFNQLTQASLFPRFEDRLSVSKK